MKRLEVACEREVARDDRARKQQRLRWVLWALSVLGVAMLETAVLGCLPRSYAVLDVPRGDVYVTDGVGWPLPSKPFPGQKTPPCRKPQVEINGGCWRALEDRPDTEGECVDSYVYSGKCYVEVRASKRLPTSVSE